MEERKAYLTLQSHPEDADYESDGDDEIDNEEGRDADVTIIENSRPAPSTVVAGTPNTKDATTQTPPVQESRYCVEWWSADDSLLYTYEMASSGLYRYQGRCYIRQSIMDVPDLQEYASRHHEAAKLTLRR